MKSTLKILREKKRFQEKNVIKNTNKNKNQIYFLLKP